MNEDTRAPGAPHGQPDNSPQPSNALPSTASPEAEAGMSTPPAAPVDPGANAGVVPGIPLIPENGSPADAQITQENGDKAPETALKVGRPASIDLPVFQEVIATIESGLTVCAACRRHKISRASLYRFVGAKKEFRDSLNAALEAGPYALLEEVAYKRAIRGHIGKGKPSDVLLALLLRGTHPRYRDSAFIANSVTVNAEAEKTIQAQAKTIELLRENFGRASEAEREALEFFRERRRRIEAEGLKRH